MLGQLLPQVSRQGGLTGDKSRESELIMKPDWRLKCKLYLCKEITLN